VERKLQSTENGDPENSEKRESEHVHWRFPMPPRTRLIVASTLRIRIWGTHGANAPHCELILTTESLIIM
jgi:hypothetical protein